MPPEATAPCDLWKRLLLKFAATPVTLQGVLNEAAAAAGADGRRSVAHSGAAHWLEHHTLTLRFEQLVEGWRYVVPPHLRGYSSPQAPPAEAESTTVVGVNDLGFLFDAALNKHQFDALKFGIFLDAGRRLLLLPLDPQRDMTKSGECTASSGFVNTEHPRDCTGAAENSLSTRAREVLRPTNFAQESDADDRHGDERVCSANAQVLAERHEFLVVQLVPRDGGGRAGGAEGDVAAAKSEAATTAEVVPLFRLVFRNECATLLRNGGNSDEATLLKQAAHFPVFHLRAVYVSQRAFYTCCDEIAAAERRIAMQRANGSDFPSGGGGGDIVAAATTNVREAFWAQLRHDAVAAARTRGSFDWICDAWAAVLEGVARAAMAARSTGMSILEDPEVARVARELASSSTRALQQINECGICCPYMTSYERMERRVTIKKRSPGLVADWRDGRLDVLSAGVDADAGAGAPAMATCVRVLFRDTRTGRNYVEGNELVAFIPQDSDIDRRVHHERSIGCDPLTARDAARARLRMWLLKLLVTAEIHGVHQLLIELDYPMIIGQCIGFLDIAEDERRLLLSDAPTAEAESSNSSSSIEEVRLRYAMFHISCIAVETIEDFVQHSGVLWRVTLAAREDENVELLRTLLDAIRRAKLIAERHCTQPQPQPQPHLECSGSGEEGRSGEGGGGGGSASPRASDESSSIAQSQAHFSAAPPPLPQDLVNQASSRRLLLDDASLFALFQYLDIHGEGAISVDELVKLFLCKENRIRHFHERKSNAPYRRLMTIEQEAKQLDHNLAHNPLTALDGCGLPFDESSIRKFVTSFCRGVRAARRTIRRDGAQSAQPPLTMSFPEFSVMMLALARR